MRALSLTVALTVMLVGVSLAATTHDFRLSDLKLVACRVAGERVVLDRWFDQGEQPGLSLEAEAALDVVADPPGGVAEAGCSGGRCLVRVDRALFPVNVTHPGRYRRWVRGFFPQGGGWLHSESLDYGPPQWFTDCDGSTAGRWVWVAGPVYDLSAGPHLLWLHNWHGGARLDKVLLLPEAAPAPTDAGPVALPLTPARRGWALTNALAVPGLRQLQTAAWPQETRGGRVDLAVSLDGGATRVALQPELLPLAATGALSRVALRADLQTAPDGASPALAAPRVSYDANPEQLVALSDSRVRATFLRATGGLVELYDKTAAVACLRGSSLAPPFAVWQLPPGAKQPERVPDEAFRLTALEVQGARLTAKYATAAGLRLTLRVVLQDGKLTFDLLVNNGSPVEVVEVTCPSLPGARLGDSSADDRLMMPQWQGGVETTDPVRTGGDGIRYPTGGGMCWFDLYEDNPRHGVYLSGHDQTLTGCTLGAAADRESDSLTFALTKWIRIRPGQSWQSAPVVVGVHDGDWHRAADDYRAWARTWMRRPSPPEWVREADGWYGLVASASGPKVPFRQFPEYLARARELGTNYIQVWGQMSGGNNCDALPYPNPVLGTADEFRAAIREIRRQGGHITFYISSQFWRVDYEPTATAIGSTPRELVPPGVPLWDWREWQAYALRGYDGGYSGDTDVPPDQRARYETPWLRTIICPATDAWARRHLQYWAVDQYARTYGASGIYLDETCAASERMCLATNHGHASSGIWGQSLTRDMKAMVEGGRQVDPNWTFAMEGCGDAIGQFADMNLISPASAKKPGQWGANRHYAPECFHYTFPEYILYDGVANGMYGKTQEDCFLDVHLHGNRYDSFSVEPARPYVQLRQRTKQLLYRATFRDTVGVTTADPAVRAKLNVLQDAANDVRLINLANPEHKPGVTVTVAAAASPEWQGYYFDLEGKEGAVAVTPSAQGLTFAAPLSRAATVLLSRRCEPLARVAAASVAAGDQGWIGAGVTNPRRGSQWHTVGVEGRFPGATPPPTKVMLPGQTTTGLRLSVSVPAGAERRCFAGHVVVKTGTVTVRRPLDFLVTSPFQTDAGLQPGGLEITVTNLSRSRQQAQLTLAGPLWAKPMTRTVDVPGGQSATVGVPLETEVRDPVEIQATLSQAGQTERQSLWVRPLVVNGGFERAGVGGRPAEWSYQNEARVATDTDAGNPCLRLNGQPGLFVEGDQVIPARPGVTYEARCRMKRTPEAGDRVQPAIVVFFAAGGENYHYLTPVGPERVGEWTEYAVRFTVAPNVARTAFYLYNVNSAATAWFDDVRVTAVP
jgi:hypothetical protein